MGEIDIVCFSSRFGLADYAVSLAREMSQSRRVSFITSSPLDERFRDLDVEMVLLFRRARHYPIDIWRLISFYLARRRRTVLFQSWLLVPGFEGLILRLFSLAGHRLFISVHDTLPHHPRPWSRGELSFFYRGFHGLIAHSPASEMDLRALGITAPITVVPHATHDMFITREMTRAEARRQIGIAADKIVYLQFGHIDSRKGCFEFLETARRCADVQQAHFLVAGNNELAPKDRASFENYRGLPNLTIVEGHVPFDEVQVYFTASDVVVAPYREGTTSGVYRLGVAFGKPVVATEIGDLRDAIARGTAFSIGRDAEVVDRFEAFVRAHLDDLDSFAAEALARMRMEAVSNSWAGAAQKYLDFIDVNTLDKTNDSSTQPAKGRT
jgi:glycosyltransferase involved in cell wall biosynthesis